MKRSWRKQALVSHGGPMMEYLSITLSDDSSSSEEEEEEQEEDSSSSKEEEEEELSESDMEE